jgi:hypothetical protein
VRELVFLQNVQETRTAHSDEGREAGGSGAVGRTKENFTSKNEDIWRIF